MTSSDSTSSHSFKRPESVLVLVYTQQSDVLLMQRLDTPDFWQSVTGSLEADELAADAAQRELFEETGIEAPHVNTPITDHQCSSLFVISGAWRKRYHPDHTHNREHLFSVQLDNQVEIKLNDTEHSACIWLPVDQAIERATSPTNKRAIEDIVLSAQYRR